MRAHSTQQWIRSHYPVAGLNDRSVIIGLVRADNGVWQWTDGTVYAGDASQLYEHLILTHKQQCRYWNNGKPVEHHLNGVDHCGYMRINEERVYNVHCDLRGVIPLIVARYICERTLGEWDTVCATRDSCCTQIKQ